MLKFKKHPLSILLVFVILLCVSCRTIKITNITTDLPDDKEPAEIALSMTSNPASSININWTTLDISLTNPVVKVWEQGTEESKAKTFKASIEVKNVSGSTIIYNKNNIDKKSFYTAKITGLKADKEYYYRCGTDNNMSNIKSFKTAISKDEDYTFIYVTDPQTSGSDAKAWNANLDMANKLYPNARFIYIAGDLTDNGTNEGEWESFFNQPSNKQHNEDYTGKLVSSIPVVAAMGNHDNLNGGSTGILSHFNFDSDVAGVPLSYAFDYGNAHFVILNLENDYDMNNTTALASQTQFLKDEVTKAKEAGKWVIVGFHKAIYSGADHMDDDDVIFNRKYWSPVLSQLDVDVVLQGHDHVLSRGFINGEGKKAEITVETAKRTYTANKTNNYPLYYVGNAGGALKFYPPLDNNDWIKENDPVLPNYEFLDIDSALPVDSKTSSGQVLSPGPCTNDELDGNDKEYYRAPTFTAVTVSKNSISFETFMTGFNSKTNSIIHDTFMYDSLTINKEQ